jgi:hypothetical protein
VRLLPKTNDTSAIETRWGHVVRRSTLPGKVSRELAAGAAGVTGVTFEPGFYEDVRAAAARWQARAGTGLQVAVLVPAGLWGLGAGFAFPDRDISLLGIGRHHFFLFHSAIPVWLLKKFYPAYLARQGDSQAFKDRVVQKIWGIIGAGMATAGSARL